jgi:hypothetical protein
MEKLKISERCKIVVTGMLKACGDAFRAMSDMRNNRSKPVLDTAAYELYTKVQEIAGPGVAHIFALNFVQVA